MRCVDLKVVARSRSGLLTRWTDRLKGGSAEWDGSPGWDGSVRMKDGLIGSWVCGVISPMDEVGRSVHGFMARSHRRVEGTKTMI